MTKLKFAFYYAVIQFFPHTRYVSWLSKFRAFYVCRVLKLGPYHRDTRIQNNVYISGPGKVTIGRSCQINENVFIQGAEISDNVMIAAGVSILCNVKAISDLGIPMNSQGWSEKNKLVKLHSDVWVGRNAIILPGCEIGEGSIVGAGAVVTKSFPPYSVIGGNPARVIRSRLQSES